MQRVTTYKLSSGTVMAFSSVLWYPYFILLFIDLFKDLSQFPMAFKIHVDSFWSMLEVDITATLKQLRSSDDFASGEVLRVFYRLNQYCITQSDSYMCFE